MAYLVGLSEPCKGEKILIKDGRFFLIGRDPKQCDLILEPQHISRIHVKIFRKGHDFFIEDVSKAGTKLNNIPIKDRGPQLLRHGCKIAICENQFRFEDDHPPDTSNEDDPDWSTVEAILQQSSKEILETQPAEKLTLLLEILTDLTVTLQIHTILPKIVEMLLKVFRKANRAFLIHFDEESDTFRPLVIRPWKDHESSKVTYSRSIIRSCLATGNAFLCKDTRDMSDPSALSVINAPMRSFICAPLKGRGNTKPSIVLQIDTQDPRSPFNEEDMQLLAAVACQAGVALENAQLHEDLVEKSKHVEDMRLAREILLSFLPSSYPSVPGYSFAANYEPAHEVGGDYYDFLILPDQRLAVLVGDVTGKGVSASLLMAKFSSAARLAFQRCSGPGQALTELNALTQDFSSCEKSITMVATVIDPINHEVSIANAGHPLPILYRSAQKKILPATSLEQSGYAIGYSKDLEYEESILKLEPGDCLLLYSDGVPDARNKAKKFFQTSGIYNALHGLALDPGLIIDCLFEALEDFCQGGNRGDDTTIVSFGRNPIK